MGNLDYNKKKACVLSSSRKTPDHVIAYLSGSSWACHKEWTNMKDGAIHDGLLYVS